MLFNTPREVGGNAGVKRSVGALEDVEGVHI